MISAHRPTILVEVHWLGDSFLDYVREEISPLGYACRRWTGPSSQLRSRAITRRSLRSKWKVDELVLRLFAQRTRRYE
jgi:hypothetical protein